MRTVFKILITAWLCALWFTIGYNKGKYNRTPTVIFSTNAVLEVTNTTIYYYNEPK